MNAPTKPVSYFGETRAIVSSPAPLGWLTTLDHKRLGVLYLVVSALALVTAEALSAFVQKDLAGSAVLALLFLTPSLPAALGTFVLPLQLGQTSSALPRVGLLGFWVYVLGAAAVLFGIASTDWAKPEDAGFLPMLGGAILLGVSAILSAFNLLATIALAVVRGLPASRVTVFAWSVGATSVSQILGGLALLGVVPALGFARIGILTTEFHARVLAHPWSALSVASTVMLVPALGIVSDIFATFAGKRPAGFGFAATSVTALAWLTLLTWGTPLFIAGDDLVAVKLDFATALLTIPLAVLVFTWLATLHRGRITLATPMLWALGTLFTVTLAAPAGLLIGLLPTGLYLRDTPFEIGFRQYLFVGVPILGFFGGVHYFWPKITGKLYDPRLAGAAFALVFLGIQATYLPLIAQGVAPSLSALASVSLYGSYALAAGVVVSFLVLAVSLLRGAQAPANPWAASTLEWTIPSPPPLENFDGDPADTAAPLKSAAHA